ncbi:MAG TPA: bifunctional YncE family protein/alkaline phosphatase family protein [Fimbriimonas sp.]|nr:bifunctional YncE family protein/alkaline phosphatase family protein [Fimbriimonas sp.]
MRYRVQLSFALAAIGAACFGGYGIWKGRVKPTGPTEHVLFNGWGVTPVGEHVLVGDMPLKLLLSPDGKQVVTTSLGFSGSHLTSIDAQTHAIIDDNKQNRVWNGLAFSPDGSKLYVGGGNSGKLHVFSYAQGKMEKVNEVSAPSSSFISGVAVQPSNGHIYVCNEALNQIYDLDPDTLKPKTVVNTGSNPHSCLFGEDKRYLYVSNWGSNSVTVIDTSNDSHVRDIRVGVRPNDMALAPDGRLFVACAGDNSVHVIQTRSLESKAEHATQATRPPEGVREILNTSIEPTELEGSSPVGVSVAPDGKTLYVANADNNDVMVADISDPKQTHIKGFIPTGWYPTCVLAAGDQLLVTTGKGLHSRPNYPARTKSPDKGRQKQPYDYTGSCFEGHVSFIPYPADARLAELTALVEANTPFRVANIESTAEKSDSVVPDTIGKGSPIKHILYVVMENRTYDQVFGDMKEGNGEPYLCMYGQKITPNRHQLARDYVLLDNLYCNSEVSVDGHSWCDAAIATDENQRQWTSGYSGHGDITNGEELETPAAGYLWDDARRHGLTVMSYGEGDSEYNGGHAIPSGSRGTWDGRRDMDRADGWIEDLHKAEKTGKLANFMIMSLGEDHTSGTRPGSFTPEASVGSNDQAIGKIVEAASKSKFWNSMAIFFVEDDAQNGPDHVDAHRTFGLVVSPWVKRKTVDHTMYTQVSMDRTMELLLGLPPMTQYDASAQPMFDVFMKRPIDTLFTRVPAETDLYAKNTARSPGAEASSHMDFSEYDRAPEDELNRVLWAEAKGNNTPYPGIHRAYLR